MLRVFVDNHFTKVCFRSLNDIFTNKKYNRGWSWLSFSMWNEITKLCSISNRQDLYNAYTLTETPTTTETTRPSTDSVNDGVNGFDKREEEVLHIDNQDVSTISNNTTLAPGSEYNMDIVYDYTIGKFQI